MLRRFSHVVPTILVLLAAAFAGCTGDEGSGGSPSPSTSPTPGANMTKPETVAAIRVTDLNPQAFYKFTPATITTKLNNTVNVTLTSPGGPGGNQQGHTFTITELNVAIQIPVGQTVNKQFDASRTGTFAFYCSIGNHRQLGMVGSITIET